MTILSQLLTPTPRAANVNDERLWSSWGGAPSATGMSVTPETALKVSTVWACIGLLADCVAMLPAIVYQRLPDGGRERAEGHPLYTLLHDLPNSQQTAFEFKNMMQGHLLLRGNAYARILPGPRGPADQLIPLHPDKVRVEELPDGRLRYKVREADGVERPYTDEDILHLRGLSADGKVGLSFVSYARETIGLSLATERSRGKFFGNGSRVMGVLKTPGKLSSDAGKRVKASWDEAQSGVENSFRTAVLEEGLEWQAIGLNYKDAQFIEGAEFTAEDICRWLRVPPHMVGLTSKATSWGSGIEQMSLGFVTYTLMPWLIRWQQAISRDLIIATQKYYVEFLVDALLRSDLKSRYDAYAIARNWGWLSVNDIRRRENENPIPDGDIYLQPLNMVEAGSPTNPPVITEGLEGQGGARGAHYEQLLYEAAGRIIRKEIAALSKAERKGALLETAETFYADHAEFVAQTIHIPVELADRYVAEQIAEMKLKKAASWSDWESRRVADLVALAMHPEHPELVEGSKGRRVEGKQ